ncbi:hypothetical protein BSKO_00138 [Bryopsis sp. KO-2023]|nr:hypothetical protein BSKO_00138 [Bryopsis sp. KO-2023]
MFAVIFEALYKLSMGLIHKDLFPDFLIRVGIRQLLQKRLLSEGSGGVEGQQTRKMEFVNELKTLPIAVQTEAANEQHYEVPTEYFKLCLGKWLKYSSCYYKSDSDTLDQAEENMMSMYCTRAKLEDGQNILELGCGWGSLTLFLASAYPKSKITGVSNSDTQKLYIDSKAKELGLNNITIITQDVTDFHTTDQFDRVLSVEMFEHMKNYQALLENISSWLAPGGLVFLHFFCHKTLPYHFKVQGPDDWMSRYFFSGGTMPSLDLMLYFQDHLRVKDIKYVNGTHYSKTLEAWLEKMDDQTPEVMTIFKETYGEKDANKWRIYWRLFYLACSELFNYNQGNEWGLAHVLFEKK